MRVTLIHNPRAGVDDQPDGARLVELIEARGHVVRYRSIERRGWKRALERRADLVVVAGGDGSVGKVGRRLVGRRVPVAVLPMGTANNISRTLDVGAAPLQELVLAWERSRRVAMDVGRARGPWGERHFLEGVGLGLFSEHLVDDELRGRDHGGDAEQRRRRGVQELRDRLRASRPVRLSAALDGRDISGDYLLLEALVGRFLGPGLPLAPDGEHDDGMLDVVLVGAHERKLLHEHLRAWQSGRAEPSALRRLRGKRLHLHWTGFPIHLDDKPWPDARKRRAQPPAVLRLTAKRRRLTFLVP